MNSRIRVKSDFVRNVTNNFIEKFRDKSNLVTKEGLLLVLFKPEEHNQEARKKAYSVSSFK